MPKMKSHSAAKKRFSRTAKGHFKHKQAHKSHLLTHESSKRKRKLRGTKVVHELEREGDSSDCFRTPSFSVLFFE
jgi:large subunit ribosomal protein L35